MVYPRLLRSTMYINLYAAGAAPPTPPFPVSNLGEEKSKEDWFLEISAREEKASQTLRQLQKEIKAEKAEREKQARAAPQRARRRQPEPALERVLAACPLAL